MTQPLFAAGTTLEASRTGKAVPLGRSSTFAGVITWSNTGSPVGTFKLEVGDGTTWATKAAWDAEFSANPGGGASACVFCFVDVGYAFCRVTYTRTSGGSGASTVSGNGGGKDLR